MKAGSSAGQGEADWSDPNLCVYRSPSITELVSDARGRGCMSDVGCWCCWSGPLCGSHGPRGGAGRKPARQTGGRRGHLADRSRWEVRRGRCTTPPAGCQGVTQSVSRSIGESGREPSPQRRPGAPRVVSQRILGVFVLHFLCGRSPPLLCTVALGSSSLLALLHVRGREPAHLHEEE